jgi:two-component system phosphorelay protein LuxU
VEYLNQHKVEQLTREIGVDNIPVLLEIFTGELITYQQQLNCGNLAAKSAYLKEISHALKSSAASFGADALCHLALSVDEAVKQDDFVEKDEDISFMMSCLNETHQVYSKYLKSLKSNA